MVSYNYRLSRLDIGIMPTGYIMIMSLIYTQVCKFIKNDQSITHSWASDSMDSMVISTIQ